MCSDTMRNATTGCQYPGCDKAVWNDPDGSYSLFCGITHLRAMAKLPQQAGAAPAVTCKNCCARPVYVQNGRAHDFCGKRCADAYRNQPISGPRANLNSSEEDEPSTECSLKGCNKPVFVTASGTASRFCSNRHRINAVLFGEEEACLMCAKYPKAKIDERLSEFCSKTCSTAAFAKAPMILQLPENHQMYKNVSAQFIDQWKHTTQKPTIEKIWKIISNSTANDKFARYQLAVERRTNLDKGNSKRRWHGTIRACTLGNDEYDTTLCPETSTSCSLCSIIRSSFQLAKFGARTNFGRFGAGLYTSATSSKANDYVHEQCSSSKAMLLNDVVLGKTKKLTSNYPTLTQPPAGFDSVIGEPGGDLNYDESIGA
ncbi:hypothetical protein FA95DRAFT_1153694 [Auriscalpium vulgare]|uniref:Uncharacterized protein n=1 Tax=Auriscalpium vulgare TaxID=40419 RepID=A0ACB8RVP8_9AGAM|nr:hypothetical protein FA95DRAFT_1153694 [Auriscalpium vulgare]